MNIQTRTVGQIGEDQQLKNVLIVDDDSDVLSSLRDMLEIEDESYIVKTAENASAVKKVITSFSPHVAMLDIKLGRTNGLDLIPILKQKYPDIICIMMTAYRETEYAVTAVRFGADDYLFKPLDPQRTVKMLNRYIVKQQLAREKKESERRFRAVFDQTFQMLFLLDSNGYVLEVNEAALEFINFDRKQVDKKLIWETKWWKDSQIMQRRIKNSLTNVLAEKKLVLGEVDMRDADGRQFTFDYSIKPVLGDENEIDLIIAEFRDASEHKQAKYFLTQAHTIMEQQVRDRTKEMETERKAAEQASRAKTEFLSRMSHEFRTPLNTILGFGQLLEMEEDSQLTQQEKDYLSKIMQGGKQLLELVNQVLNLAQIDSGKCSAEIEAVSLIKVVNEAVELIQPLAISQDIRIKNRIVDQSSCQLQADPGFLKQILVNLMSNAIKFNHRNGEMTLSYYRTKPGRISVCISDTGSGIAEEKQAKLFEPFDCLDHYQGMGIGLTVAKKLVEKMGGSIGVESIPGEGSTFWIELDSVD